LLVALLVWRESGQRIDTESDRALVTGIDESVRRFGWHRDGIADIQDFALAADLCGQLALQDNKNLIALCVRAGLIASGLADFQGEEAGLASLGRLENFESAASFEDVR